MQIKQWAKNALLIIFLGIAGCGKHDVPAASALSAASDAQVSASDRAQEEVFRAEDVIRAALTMVRDFTTVTDLQGKFAGYGSIEAIAKRTDARKNIYWKEFAGASDGSMQGPYGYHTPLGDFVTVSALTPSQKKIGLVVNLTNQKTAFYQHGSPEITPASSDKLASAFVVLLEVRERVNSTLAVQNFSADELHAHTVSTLEKVLGRTEGNQTLTKGGRESATTESVAATGNVYADAIAAQGGAIESDSSTRKSKELGQVRSEAMHKRVLELFYAVFEDAKKAGLKFSDPRKHIHSVNIGRRNSGVWELTVEPYGSDPHFVVIRDFTSASGMFSVESVGAISAHAKIHDPRFEETGKFSEGCLYEISAGSRSVKYDCMAFLDGRLDNDVFSALRDLVIAQIKEVGNLRTQ